MISNSTGNEYEHYCLRNRVRLDKQMPWSIRVHLGCASGMAYL